MSTISLTTKNPIRADPDEESTSVLAEDGTRLFVRRRQASAPLTVVMCDGIVCDGFIYKYLWNDLATSASLVHFHYRGHGRSALPADPARIGVEDFAADLNAVRRQMGDPPAVLMGHSVGTQVCLEAYRLRPDRIVGMVMLCGSYGRVTHTFHGTDLLAQLLPRIIEVIEDHPRLARALWSRVPPKFAVKVASVLGEVDPNLNPEDLVPYFEHVADMDVRLFVRMLERAGDHSAEDLLPRISVPVLVIAGDRDSFTPSALSRRMCELLPKGELLMIPGGTHVSPLEHHEEVANKIRDFLSRLSNPDAVRAES